MGGPTGRVMLTLSKIDEVGTPLCVSDGKAIVRLLYGGQAFSMKVCEDPSCANLLIIVTQACIGTQ